MRTKSPSEELLIGGSSALLPAGQSPAEDEFETSPFDLGEKHESSSRRSHVQLKDKSHRRSELESTKECSGKKPEILTPSVISGSFAVDPKDTKLKRYEKFSYLLRKDKSNVTDEQLEMFDRLSLNAEFRDKNKMAYYDIPDYLIYLKLVEEKIKLKDENYQFEDLNAWFADNTNKEISNREEVNKLLRAVKSNEINAWSRLLQKSQISNETVLKLGGLIKKTGVGEI